MAFKTSQIEAEKIEAQKLSKKSTVKLKTNEQKEILEAEKVYRQGITTVKDLIAPASFKVDPRSIELNGQFLTTIFVINYPRYISVGWFSPVINYNSPLDVSMFFYQVKTEVILKQLKKKVGALEAQLMADAEKGAPRDPLRETALRDIEGLRDDLTQGTEKFFQFSLYVTIYGETREELESLVERMESVFGSKLVRSEEHTSELQSR